MQKLNTLSDQELELRLKNLVQRERQLLHVILEHIKEFDTRRLYLERAYSSLYEYLTKELGYSGAAAMRRIEAARLLRDLPVLAEKIQEGTLNLSQIGELSRSLKEKESLTGQKVTCLQKENLLTRIAGKSTLETQKELAVALDIPVKDFEKQKMQKDESVRMELTFSKDQYQKLLACRDLAAHLLEQKHSDSSWAAVLEVLADQYLAKKTASKIETMKSESANGAEKKNAGLKNEGIKIARKDFVQVESMLDSKSTPASKAESVSEFALLLASELERESAPTPEFEFERESKPESESKSKPNPTPESKTEQRSKSKLNTKTTTKPTTATVSRRINRTLTVKMRKTILQRHTCCQYKDPQTGRQCCSTYGLQVDHRTPQWVGGNHSPENLQVLCGHHNRYKYHKESHVKFK